MNKQIKEYLEKNKIKYEYFEHPAVFTCEEAEVHCKHVPGIPWKNLFLRGKKSNKLFLVSLPAYKKGDLKKLGELLNEKHLSFASAEQLKEILNLEPGSVSPFGLLNDKEKKVKYLIDQELWDADIVNFHPNINTASIALKKADFHKYVKSLENEVKVIDFKS